MSKITDLQIIAGFAFSVGDRVNLCAGSGLFYLH